MTSRHGVPFTLRYDCLAVPSNGCCLCRQLSKSIWWQTGFSAAQILLSFCLVWRLGAIGECNLDTLGMANVHMLLPDLNVSVNYSEGCC